MAIAITLIYGTIYATVQQVLRQSANDPQIQIVEDTTEMLAAGQPVQSVVPQFKVDMAKSLAPFVIVFDNQASPVASSVKLGGQTPKVPAGVFAFVRRYGQERFTWEPKRGVRAAVILRKYKSGFVLAGRSLREVENRELRLEMVVGLAWLVTLGTTFVAFVFFKFLASRENR